MRGGGVPDHPREAARETTEARASIALVAQTDTKTLDGIGQRTGVEFPQGFKSRGRNDSVPGDAGHLSSMLRTRGFPANPLFRVFGRESGGRRRSVVAQSNCQIGQ